VVPPGSGAAFTTGGGKHKFFFPEHESTMHHTMTCGTNVDAILRFKNRKARSKIWSESPSTIAFVCLGISSKWAGFNELNFDRTVPC
jgi:hypothetical protein